MSETPLARKLGVKAGERLLVCRAPQGWSVHGLPERVSVVQEAEHADVVVAFVRRAEELRGLAGELAEVAWPDGALWVAWPRRAAGHRSDVTDNTLRAALLPVGLVDVKVAALDDDWSGLKFVWRKELRA